MKLSKQNRFIIKVLAYGVIIVTVIYATTFSVIVLAAKGYKYLTEHNQEQQMISPDINMAQKGRGK